MYVYKFICVYISVNLKDHTQLCMSLRLILSHTDELLDGPTKGSLPWSTGPSTSHSLPHSVHLLQETPQQCTATGNLQVSRLGLGVIVQSNECQQTYCEATKQTFAIFVFCETHF